MPKYSKEEKLEFMKMTLDDKIKRTKQLIMEWYAQFDGKVYVSFSGGKDSTVLLHIARNTLGCSDIVGVFDDTGLEYPEIRDFVRKQENIIWIKPKKTFYQVIKEYGWPIISKEQSLYIRDAKQSKSEKLRKLRIEGRNGRFKISKKWLYLIDAPFKISNECCNVMKKSVAKKFEKESKLKPMIATMAEESNLRMEMYMRGDCNEYSAKRPISKPMSFWTEKDVLDYIQRYNLEIASVYGEIKDGKLTGVSRTGCMFCMYGLHLQGNNNKFEQMKVTHPKLHDYIMNKLGGSEVLKWYLDGEGND